MRLLPFLFALLALPALAQSDTCTATTETVERHIGETITFCGTPTDVNAPEPGKVKSDPVYLNFGGEYPHHTFSVVIWGDVSGKQRSKLVKRYSGRALRVHGWVKTYKDKPVIEVKSLKDITVE